MPQTLNRFGQIQQPPLGGGFQQTKGASDAQSATHSFRPTPAIIHENGDGSHLARQTDCFPLAFVNVERLIQNRGRLDLDPVGQSCRPTTNMRRGFLVLQFTMNGWGNQHLLK
jgi:hypothetical protein